jgi:hypothetical protein
MLLVETLRLRAWSLWWAAVIAAIGIVLVVTVQHVHSITVVNVDGTRMNGPDIPAVALATIAMFLAMIFATSVGLSLNKEGHTLALTWTKPVARPLIALRIVAVDVVAVVAAYVFAWLVILGVVAGCGGSITGAPAVSTVLALSLGVALMWFALIAAITSALPANTGVVVGFLWPGALILASLNVHINATIDTIVRLLNVFNPLAYINGSTSASSDGRAASYWQGAPDERALIVWLLACVLVAIAVGLWTRREA